MHLWGYLMVPFHVYAPMGYLMVPKGMDFDLQEKSVSPYTYLFACLLSPITPTDRLPAGTGTERHPALIVFLIVPMSARRSTRGNAQGHAGAPELTEGIPEHRQGHQSAPEKTQELDCLHSCIGEQTEGHQQGQSRPPAGAPEGTIGA